MTNLIAEVLSLGGSKLAVLAWPLEAPVQSLKQSLAKYGPPCLQDLVWGEQRPAWKLSLLTCGEKANCQPWSRACV